MGAGPALVLVHGTGASTHSWQGLAPLLARHFTVLALDLPGHGFTEMPAPERLSLPGMSGLVSGLLETLGVEPAIAVGHSAGAAILARMCLDGRIAPTDLISLNGAFLPLRGVPVQLLSPVVKRLVSFPVLPNVCARLASNQGVVERLLGNTGSRLETAAVEQYRRLFRSPGHVAAALGMMANWQLEPLVRELGRLPSSLTLIAGGNDRTIPPADALRLRKLVPTASILPLPGLGHLAHEEAPEIVARLIEPFARQLDQPRRG
jgi:magnesium chelatase accessory protein